MRSSVVLSVIVVGVTEMSVEFAALMSFQSLYGYVYGRVALLVAAFMAGLVLGGRLGVLAVRRGMRLAAFIALQAGIAAVPIGLWLAVSSISGAGPTAMAAWSHAFPLVVVAAAVLAGAQFPLAAGLCMGPRDEPGDIGGWLHGADLAGAAVGATLTAVFLLPVLGLAGAMTSLSLLNAGALVALLGAALLTRRSR